MSEFEIRNGEKSYWGKPALTCKFLRLNKSECIGVTGANGSGKSTLLRVISGITQLTKGNVKFSDAWRRATIFYSPQGGGLYSDLTIEENLTVFQQLFGVANSDDQARQLWHEGGLSTYGKTKVRNLSGGFQKLASVFTACSVKADILVLDEPSGDLGASYTGIVAGLLRSIQKNRFAVIFADHSPEMLKAATRIVSPDQP
jgi:ABC-type multidrug transport system ATPase subunit